MAARRRRRWQRLLRFRLARSLHPPAVVGHYYDHMWGPGRRSTISFVPSSPPAPIDDGCFSLDFLPFDVTGGLGLDARRLPRRPPPPQEGLRIRLHVTLFRPVRPADTAVASILRRRGAPPTRVLPQRGRRRHLHVKLQDVRQVLRE
jgi:hypothetical protein